MMMPNPEDVLSQRDPGDDMQRRLRYQAAYGALICLELMDEIDCAQVFCEHHEDFLIKKLSGKYTGIQVKTALRRNPTTYPKGQLSQRSGLG